MRSRSLLDMLTYEASRRPEVAALVARVDTLTDDDITSAEVPLPWYRNALRQLRDKRLNEVRIKRAFGPNDANVLYGKSPDPMGEMREWAGGHDFLDLGGTKNISISPGNLLWLPDTGGVWYETTFGALSEKLLVQTTFLERISKSGYTERYKERLLRMCPVDAEVIDLTGGQASNPLVRYGVRFSSL